MSNQVQSRGEYLLVRNMAERERLDMQYKAWQANIGYLLHPIIKQQDHMRIADLDGFDLSDAMFPCKNALPENITFHQQNLLEPFPDEYLGKYDVVNVRVMVVALSSDEWEPAVRNLMTLLKPGGHLQWTDCAAHECVVKGEPIGKRATNARYGLDLFRRTLISLGKTPNIAALHGIFRKSGLKCCEERIYTLDDPGAREDLNFTVVVGIQHVLATAFQMQKLDEIQSMDQIMGLRKAMLSDLHNIPCYYCFDVYVVVGRKA
ncbi:hypothetical protein N7510_003769 [Penicillium lagena]|uniref:uncharacterized protein n=1 Tax=Penicillium lagena TaxID=94218 RepID=UPI00254250A2|nr:uncharacterized protein N7510_003769 [Penicillium lagena]KAJ5619785.1 hypothetical protein N7510_003769 [Penicillium lagena]